LQSKVAVTGPPQIIRPGRDLISAARTLEDPKRLLGSFPYQWIFPGPHSRQVLANQTLPLPPAGTGPQQVLTYQVPDGLRFSLRGVVFAFFGTGWNEGTSTQLIFTLQVQAAGIRQVDFLNNVTTHLGSPDFPYPILGRLEFAPLDILIVTINNQTGSGIAAGPPNTVVAHLVGHTYPNSEAGI
jgi:hypothetical protein